MPLLRDRFLSSGTTSNNNQSNSYTDAPAPVLGPAASQRAASPSPAGRCGRWWPKTEGPNNRTEKLPDTIDPQYTAGFVWERQYGFRVAKNYNNKVWMGVSLENAQAQPAGSGANNEFLGATGDGGGLYDNQATYSYNRAPDVIAKMAFEPGWGHWELFGVARFFENRVYPTTGSPYNNTITGGGIGAGFRDLSSTRHCPSA